MNNFLKENGRLIWRLAIPLLLAQSLIASTSHAADAQTATIRALRMAGAVTGGLMPTSAPEFASMVSSLQADNPAAAAATAVSSKYFANYLPRRMARQMQNPQLSEGNIPDNDATTFIVANLIGSATTASISVLWSQNSTYLVNVGGVATHIGDLSAAQIAAINWQTDLVKVAGQSALVTSSAADGSTIFTATPIPTQHVGGYLTLNNIKEAGGSAAADLSFAQYGLKDGTNLRAIEVLYETTFGYTLPQMVVAGATSAMVPRFVPKLNPSFLVGQGQPACISCHGGGASNLKHGYATFADIFDFDIDHGLIYKPAPTTGTMKSYGSNEDLRGTVKTCNLTLVPAPQCNPDGPAASATQAWDLTLWQSGGLLTQMGWTGPITGNGLNALGTALGKAKLVYQFLTRRVQREICPLGSFSDTQINAIATQAQTSDSFASIVTAIAADPSCL